MRISEYVVITTLVARVVKKMQSPRVLATLLRFPNSLVDGADLRTFLRPPANIPISWFKDDL